jgi:glycosyltransferase involved in cell wall biosynthesis
MPSQDAAGPRSERRRGVAMLVQRYHPLFGGGAIQARRLARELRGRGWQPFFVTAHVRDLPRRERVDGIPVLRVPTFGARRAGWFALLFSLGSCLSLLLRARRWSILHVHGASAFSWFPVQLARLLGKRVIVKMTLMGADDAGGLSGGLLGRLNRRVFELADAVISISGPMSADYRRSGLDAAKLVEMPQGVDVERYRPAAPEERRALRARLGFAPEGLLLVFVGAIFHRKGADIAVRAFERLAASRPGLELAMVGMDETTWDPLELPEEQEFSLGLKRELREQGLAGRVRFTGVVDDVESYLRAADVFVFPSRREGFGTVMVEAMAAGLPCVVAPIDGIAATVFRDGEDGVIVPSEDPERWAEAIAALLDDSARAARLGRAARAAAEGRYSFGVVCERYEALYAALLAGRPLATGCFAPPGGVD